VEPLRRDTPTASPRGRRPSPTLSSIGGPGARERLAAASVYDCRRNVPGEGSMKTRMIGLAGLVAASVAIPAFAQRDVPMQNGIPVAPEGLVVPPLPKEPIVYDTAEGQMIRVSV